MRFGITLQIMLRERADKTWFKDKLRTGVSLSSAVCYFFTNFTRIDILTRFLAKIQLFMAMLTMKASNYTPACPFEIRASSTFCLANNIC